MQLVSLMFTSVAREGVGRPVVVTDGAGVSVQGVGDPFKQHARSRPAGGADGTPRSTRSGTSSLSFSASARPSTSPSPLRRVATWSASAVPLVKRSPSSTLLAGRHQVPSWKQNRVSGKAILRSEQVATVQRLALESLQHQQPYGGGDHGGAEATDAAGGTEGVAAAAGAAAEATRGDTATGGSQNRHSGLVIQPGGRFNAPPLTMMNLLLEDVTGQGRSPLHTAAMLGQVATVMRARKAGWDVLWCPALIV